MEQQNTEACESPPENSSSLVGAQPNISWKRSAQNLLSPPTCIACQDLLSDHCEVLVCQDCRSNICRPELSCFCHGCGAWLRRDLAAVDECRYCQPVDMPFSSVVSIANYSGLMNQLVVKMKSRNGQNTAIQMGNWLGTVLSTHWRQLGIQIDLVTPMPIHWMRRWSRGFNVASLLAESVCQFDRLQRKSGLSLIDHRKPVRLLRLNRKTRKQGTLTLNQRFQNVKGCFQFSGKHDIDSKSILLVDDVMTSGATAVEAARTLLQAGAGQVHLALVARGIGQQ